MTIVRCTLMMRHYQFMRTIEVARMDLSHDSQDKTKLNINISSALQFHMARIKRNTARRKPGWEEFGLHHLPTSLCDLNRMLRFRWISLALL